MQFFDSQEPAWSEMVVMLAGANVTKIEALSYTIESDDEELFGAGDEALSIQSGNIKKSGSMTLLKGALDDMQTAALAAGGRFITDVPFTAVVTYLPSDDRVVKTDTLVGIKINKMPKGWNQGDKFMKCECPFKFLSLITA